MNHLEPRIELEETIKRERDITFKFVLLQQLADEEASEGKFEHALQHYKQALRLARKMHNNKLECDILTDLGSTAEELQEIDLALSSYQKALKVARKMKNFIAQSDILDKLGILYMKMGNLDLSEQYFDQAADAADIAELPPMNTEESQTEDLAALRSTARDLIKKSIEASNEIKQLKRMRLAKQYITILVDGILLILLFIIRDTFSSEILFLVFSFFAISSGSILTYFTFASSRNTEK